MNRTHINQEIFDEFAKTSKKVPKDYDDLTPSISEVDVTLTDTAHLTFGGSKQFHIRREGNLAILTSNVIGTFDNNTGKQTIGTIPEGFRPIQNLYHTYTTLKGNSVQILLETDGKVSLYNYNGVSTITSDMICRQNLCWFVGTENPQNDMVTMHDSSNAKPNSIIESEEEEELVADELPVYGSAKGK